MKSRRRETPPDPFSLEHLAFEALQPFPFAAAAFALDVGGAGVSGTQHAGGEPPRGDPAEPHVNSSAAFNPRGGDPAVCGLWQLSQPFVCTVA